MLKSLQPMETFPGFPTADVHFEPDSSPASSHERKDSAVSQMFGGEVLTGSTTDEHLGFDRGLRLPAYDLSSSGFTNGQLPPPKSPKSKRRPYGLAYSSRVSTPTSSIGSASELQFPTVDVRSPPSPEPLGSQRAGSPLRWRSRNSSVSPVEDSHVLGGTREVAERTPSFSEFIPSTINGEALVEIVKEEADAAEAGSGEFERDEVLSTIVTTGGSADYAFAVEYEGPSIEDEVPSVEPMELKPVLPPFKGLSVQSDSPGPSSLARHSVSIMTPLPAWFSSESGDRASNDWGGRSPSFSSRLSVDHPSSSVPFSPRGQILRLGRQQEGEISASIPVARNVVEQGEISASSPEEGSRNGLEQNEEVGVSFSPVAGAYAARTEGASITSEIKPCSMSRSFGAYASINILAKSEPMALWKMQHASMDDLSGDQNLRQAGQRARSMSLPGIEGVTHGGRHGGQSFDTSTCQNTQQRRKGVCYLCHKGNRMTDKESCLVCNAKYCYNCVLTAMESMPEGRKCRTCIGKPVDEGKRLFIGKPSRLLNRLLDSQEVQQIMKAERECAANQLRPEQLYVNGRQLTSEELALLLKCANPPQKLRPGRYWYDSQSGLWGKEGERPDKLISPDMKVGGALKGDASNGSTQVFMNGRELGKLELKMLKLAGVHCPPSTHLWVEPNGSYQEEGQNTTKGNIWNKTSIRLLYPFFSLPTPGASSRYTKDLRRDSPDIYMPAVIAPNKLHRILVLGHEGSGRSTLFKQTKFLFKDGFSPEERLQMKAMIQCHIYKYIGILLEGRERFEEEEDDFAGNDRGFATGDYSEEPVGSKRNVYSLDDRLKHQAEWFLEMMTEGSLQTCLSASGFEVPLLVDELWRDPAIKASYKRKDELTCLPDVAAYFLDKVVEIATDDYKPSDDDILRSEGLAQGSGLAQVEFFLDDKMPYQDQDVASPGRYQLIKVGGSGMAEGCKWLDMFEDVHAVVFCVAISEYDEVLTDHNGNASSKVQQKDLFESVLKHPVLGEKPMVLLLNKYDLFEGKICKGIPLTSCEWFSDFKPVGASQNTPQMQAQQAYTYVAHKYKELFSSSGHKLFTFKLNAVEKDKVLEAFQYVREILKWKDNGWDLFPEESSYTSDLSSYSQHTFPTPGRDASFM